MSNKSDPGSDREAANVSLWLARPRRESGTVLESLNEIREILRELDERGWEDASPRGDGASASTESAPTEGELGKATPAHHKATALLEASIVAPARLSGDAVSIPAPLSTAAAERSQSRRNSTALAAVTVASLAIFGFGAMGLVAARWLHLPRLAGSASGERRAGANDRPEATARVGLPPAFIPAIAQSNAIVATRLPTIPPKPTATVGQAAPARAPGAMTASAVPPQPQASAPHAGGAVSTPPPHVAVRTARPAAVPSAKNQTTRKRLQEAGDVRTVRGDTASTSLFYERAADVGDVRATFGLGTRLTPAFLEPLGVLGTGGDIVTIAQSDASVAARPATVWPKPAATAGYAAPSRGPGARTASAALLQPQPSAPRAGGAISSMIPPHVVARAAPPVAAPSAEDRATGKTLREAGDVRMLQGDIASARLFYKRAADIGDARAALDLGNSFNPAFLESLGVLGMRGDTVVAARWYRLARLLGDLDAEKALKTLPR
jgi:hypothetical protein